MGFFCFVFVCLFFCFLVCLLVGLLCSLVLYIYMCVCVCGGGGINSEIEEYEFWSRLFCYHIEFVSIDLPYFNHKSQI